MYSATFDVTHLLLDVVEGIRRVDREANKDDVRVGVTERSETIIIFLAGGIPKRQLDVLAIHIDVGDVVLEHGRYIHLSHARQQGQRPVLNM